MPRGYKEELEHKVSTLLRDTMTKPKVLKQGGKWRVYVDTQTKHPLSLMAQFCSFSYDNEGADTPREAWANYINDVKEAV